MTFALYNTRNGDVYGYFGTPCPTWEKAVTMCFPNVNPWIHQYIDLGSIDDNIWLEDLLLVDADEVGWKEVTEIENAIGGKEN